MKIPAAQILFGSPEPKPYLRYSCSPAPAPTTPKHKKINPVTSSQSTCKTFPTEATVARTPDNTAPPTRLRLACPANVRTNHAIFFALETLPIGEFYQAPGYNKPLVSAPPGGTKIGLQHLNAMSGPRVVWKIAALWSAEFGALGLCAVVFLAAQGVFLATLGVDVHWTGR